MKTRIEKNFTKNDFNINFYSFIKHIIKHICSSVIRDSIRNLFFLSCLWKYQEKLWLSAVDFMRQKLYQTKSTKIVINFICQLLVKVLKIHKKKSTSFFLLEEIPHDLTNQCFLYNLNQYLLEKSLHGPFKSLSWMHSETFLRTYEFDIPKCDYPEISRCWARAYLRPLPH